MDSLEIRCFGDLKKIFDQRNWPFPLTLDLEEQVTAAELAAKLEIPPEKIEIVFVNGTAQPLDCLVKPGDRIAFVPPGTPGPYRVVLGFVQKKNVQQHQ